MAKSVPARAIAATNRTWRLDLAVLAGAALVIRLPALVADRFLTYDDGVFGSSALLLRHGELPFRDVFSPQGPLFLPLVWVADALGLRAENAPRLLPLLAGAAVTVATYAAGRRLTTRAGALLAAALVASSGSVLWTTAAITSDGPALALATTAVALALGYRARPSTARAVAAGLALGAALCIKVLVLPAAVPVAVLLVGRRRPRDVVLAAASAVAVGLVATLPWGFGRVWDQYIAYHRDSARIASHAGAARKLVRTLVERDALVVAAGILALVGAALPTRAGAGSDRTDDDSPTGAPSVGTAAALLGAWAGGVAILLVLEPAFWRPQLAEVIPPLALLAGLRPLRPAVLLAVAALVIAPWHLAHARPMLWPGRPDRDERAAVARLTELPAGSEVITDEPGLAWRAGHRVPGQLVDASIKRIEQGQITTRVITAAAEDPDVCAVLVWDDRYGDLPGLPAGLADIGYGVAARYGAPRVLYERDDCRD